jgi:glutamyl-tRNA reductase
MIQSIIYDLSKYDLKERELLTSSLLKQEASEPHVLLATCNRTELYWGKGEVPEEILDHLFRVASGLESALIGEKAIQGQIRNAYLEAKSKYKLSSSLNRLFQSAIHVGKKVRSETHIADGAVSHSQIAVDILKEHDIDLKNKIITLIGVNKLTEDILKYLKARHAEKIFLSNRHIEKAQELAANYGGMAFPLTAKKDLLKLSDVVISATSAPHTIINIEDMPSILSPLLMIDLAFPRDISPEIGSLRNVTLYNLEDIEAYSKNSIRLRSQEKVRAEKIIEEEKEKFYEWQQNAFKLSSQYE